MFLRSELVCRVKYNNSLPDIPFDPKFLIYPFEANRFVQYNPTSLERSYKHELLTENDLGVQIDLINPDAYKIDPNGKKYLDEADERLLEEDLSTPQDSKRSRHHNRNVSWLRKTEYISTEYNRFTQLADKAEAKIGFSIKKYFKEEDLYKDRDSQIKAIENTFDAVKIPIEKHYSKPNVYPVDVLPVLPDFDLWKHPCAQVIFDSDPARHTGTAANPLQNEEMSQAMIRGMVDESGDQFVAYFLPTEETIKKRKRDADNTLDYQEEDEYDYTLAREYNWNVKNKASKGYEETYFFTVKEDGVFYNELETRVRLSKRRKAGQTGPSAKSRLVVKHRPLNAVELQAQGRGRRKRRDSAASSASSRSRSRSSSGSRSGSGSRSRSRSRSGSRSASGSRSGSSRSSSPASSRSGSGSGSGSESEDEAKERRKDEEEIFGSSSGEESN
ncbi:hypothetical protein CAPTEDRAFT_117955 [Capitella teleta]|uniref:RNA polymerase II-associated factor 1 homolog n=1 Tax=Capitella teleta TaxID=283909 RepID=R7V892_CAPTE|nr:hypothetical protein CAPTEDRAFT_117955 [Capitella teleta]|eukprot:ELU12581.1 hypothetical protein CAPTEDRAFT_117955 [Capitella teleta]